MENKQREHFKKEFEVFVDWVNRRTDAYDMIPVVIDESPQDKNMDQARFVSYVTASGARIVLNVTSSSLELYFENRSIKEMIMEKQYTGQITIISFVSISRCIRCLKQKLNDNITERVIESITKFDDMYK